MVWSLTLDEMYRLVVRWLQRKLIHINGRQVTNGLNVNFSINQNLQTWFNQSELHYIHTKKTCSRGLSRLDIYRKIQFYSLKCLKGFKFKKNILVMQKDAYTSVAENLPIGIPWLVFIVAIGKKSNPGDQIKKVS